MRRAVNCKKETLELAYGYDEEEKWKPIIQRSKVVRIPENKEIPTEDELAELSTVWAIMERDQIEIKDNSQVVDQIKTSPKFACNFPLDVLILDSEKEEAEQISGGSGVATFASVDVKPDCLKKRDVGDIMPGDHEKCESWEQFFIKVSQSPFIPSNALILIDRYLFLQQNGATDYPDAFYNLEHILNSILPDKLACDYHVLIVVQAFPKKNQEYDITSLYNAFETIRCKLNRPYKIVIELATLSLNASIFPYTHDRKLISNYFVGDTSHGFKVFKSSSGTPKFVFQKLSYECIFHEVDPGRFPTMSVQESYLTVLHDYFMKQIDEKFCKCFNTDGNPCRPNELRNRLLR